MTIYTITHVGPIYLKNCLKILFATASGSLYLNESYWQLGVAVFNENSLNTVARFIFKVDQVNYCKNYSKLPVILKINPLATIYTKSPHQVFQGCGWEFAEKFRHYGIGNIFVMPENSCTRRLSG